MFGMEETMNRYIRIKHTTIGIMLLLAALLTGCSGTEKQTASSNETDTATKRKLIIDTDTGADDASALILAACNENAELLGVTVLAGNVELEQGASNALMALEIAGADVPVYKGMAENTDGREIEAFSVYGTDGMGDLGLVHPERTVEDDDAIDFILDTVNKYPGEVELVALGPATNIAAAMERDPDTMKKVKMIWSMGTAGLGPGNATPVAEFNVFSDPLAYKEMLDFGIPVTIVGLDMCRGESEWTAEQFDKLSKTGAAGRFVAESFTKLREFYELNGSADSVMNCDSLAMACVLYPDFVKDTIMCHGSCQTDQGEAYSQVIFYQEGFIYDTGAVDYDFNVRLVSQVDKTAFFDLYLDAIRDIR